MSTFLVLARTLREECAIQGAENTPTTVTGQVGEMRRVVKWVQKAYKEVQSARPNWEFLRNDFSFVTIANTQTYTRAAVSLPEVKTWKVDSFRCYTTATGTSDEQWLTYVPWEIFRDEYLFSANRSVTKRPTHFTVRPNKSLVFWPTPDAVYTIAGECYYRPQLLAADADECLIPSEHDDVIVGKGMEYYAAFEGAPEVHAQGQALFSEAFAKLEADQLPPMGMAGALA